MQKQKINKTKEYKIENMQRYKNTKNKWLWKYNTTGRAKPSSPEFATADSKIEKYNNKKFNNEKVKQKNKKIQNWKYAKLKK